MECFDSLVAIHALIGASLIVAGASLMMHRSNVIRGFGAFCLAFGYFLLGVSASGSTLDNLNLRSHRYIVGLASAVAIVAGTFMMFYHAQDEVRKILEARIHGHTVVVDDIISSIPIIDHVLVYAGFAGLVLAMSMTEFGGISPVKAILGVAAVLVICHTQRRMVEALIQGKGVEKSTLAHILSWGLIAVAIGYSC